MTKIIPFPVLNKDFLMFFKNVTCMAFQGKISLFATNSANHFKLFPVDMNSDDDRQKFGPQIEYVSEHFNIHHLAGSTVISIESITHPYNLTVSVWRLSSSESINYLISIDLGDWGVCRVLGELDNILDLTTSDVQQQIVTSILLVSKNRICDLGTDENHDIIEHDCINMIQGLTHRLGRLAEDAIYIPDSSVDELRFR